MTSIPARVDDPKDAVLYSVLHSLEQIDQNPSTRSIFAQSVLFNLAMNLDGPAFKEEVRQIKEVLKIVDVEPVVEPVIHQATENANPREDFLMREL